MVTIQKVDCPCGETVTSMKEHIIKKHGGIKYDIYYK